MASPQHNKDTTTTAFRQGSPVFSEPRTVSSMEFPLQFNDGDSKHGKKSSDIPHLSCASSERDGSFVESDKQGGKNSENSIFKSKLVKKFQHLHEGTAKQENFRFLNDIYTELQITEGEDEGISYNDKVSQNKTFRRSATENTAFSLNDIFKPSPEQHKPIRSVLTKGVAGIGKTVSVQKFILDWAEGKENQDIHLIFSLPFKELNLIKEKVSLKDVLHIFFPETKELEISSDVYKMLFIFDGLDECCLSLDFHSSVRLCDVNDSASVDVLLINLIKGNLLPSALIWITSRPAAADLIPSECVDRVTEVRGFTDPQKEEYFSKRISDESLANRVISHLKSLRSLYIMCHIPVFCWISATVLERMLSEAESEREIPKTLTQMYTHFLIIQTNIKHQKHYERKVKDEEMILKLGKLAFEQLVKDNLIFYEEDLRGCGIDEREASVYSGVFTQIFREEFGLHQRNMYCFVHLSIQEYLAAVYAHHSFTNKNINVFDDITEPTHEARNEQSLISSLHQSAVDKVLNSKSGHLELFLRFLLSFSLESNQTLLQCLVTQVGSRSQNLEETIRYITKKIEECPTSQKLISLFLCLNDLCDYLQMETSPLETVISSSFQLSDVVFVLTSENSDVIKFTKYFLQDNCVLMPFILYMLLPVIEASTSVQLSECALTEKSCIPLAEALSSEGSRVMELNLSRNKLKDWGVKLLSKELKNPRCKLEILRLSDCGITDEGCAALASALRSNPSHLRQLNLSGNKLGDSGVKLLSNALDNPLCILEILTLQDCGITSEGCAALASALRSNPSHLRLLNLTGNKLGDSGLKLLSAGLKNPLCKLEILMLNDCGITDEGCAALTSALRSNPLHLRQLNLSGNKLGDSGVKLLSDALQSPNCKLAILTLNDCGVTGEGCAALASVMKSNLRELYLSGNELGVAGVKLLSALGDPRCKLEFLGLEQCNITDEGCAALASALSSHSTQLRMLDLTRNKLSDSGVKLLFKGLEDPYCKVEILMLNDCGITDEGCAALASALNSNKITRVRVLDLSQNKFGDSGINQLTSKLTNPQSKLETLWLDDCGITDEGCAALASALKTNLSHLKMLSLNDRKVGNLGVKHLSTALKESVCELETLGLHCDVTYEALAALISVSMETLLSKVKGNIYSKVGKFIFRKKRDVSFLEG